MLGAIFCGRLIRFTIVALLAHSFGRQVLDYMNSRIIEYVVYGLIIISVVGSIFSIYRWLSCRHVVSSRYSQATTD